MNLKEIEYIVKIAEEKGLTRAAEKLFITPSALNQQLVRLEKEIGTPLFYRSRSGWTPTEAGEVYLSAAEEMIRIKKETYRHLQDIAAVKKGALSVGLPPERGSSIFTNVYPVFHRQYPNITVTVHEISVHRQQQMIARGELDIGFMTLTEDQQTDDEYIMISQEELLLAVPAIHPVCRQTAPAGNGCLPDLDISLIREEPFALMYKESTMRQVSEAVFRRAGFSPNVLFETSRTQTILDMVDSSMCCGIISASYMSPDYQNISFFRLPDHPAWNIKASYRKGGYLNRPARFFLEQAAKYLNHQSVTGESVQQIAEIRPSALHDTD